MRRPPGGEGREAGGAVPGHLRRSVEEFLERRGGAGVMVVMLNLVGFALVLPGAVVVLLGLLVLAGGAQHGAGAFVGGAFVIWGGGRRVRGGGSCSSASPPSSEGSTSS